MLVERLFKVFLRTEKGGGLTSESFGNRSNNIESAASIFKEHGQNIAGVVTEAVQGAGGVFPLQTVSLRDSVALCDDNGSLLVFDEVITGFGRTGTGSLPTPTT
ncbi:MAG: hypothetical protein CM15mP49_32680 [Actinomycetota bacterium]|nr:MAG: hypothetical protein CM15mP49_32680 [Actinomycetota bacterium]